MSAVHVGQSLLLGGGTVNLVLLLQSFSTLWLRFRDQEAETTAAARH